MYGNSVRVSMYSSSVRVGITISITPSELWVTLLYESLVAGECIERTD